MSSFAWALLKKQTKRGNTMFLEIKSIPNHHPAYSTPAAKMKCPTERLIYWINEREAIRKSRTSGRLWPWTQDKILSVFKFCNVRREDDRVTRWIKDNWRDPNVDDPQMWFSMGVARMINWPPTLAAIGYPSVWKPKKVARIMHDMKENGHQVFTGAYMITNAGQSMSKVDTVVYMLNNLYKTKRPPVADDTLAQAHDKLRATHHAGMGSFMAAQVIADCKHTDLLCTADDWWDWCAPGPGSQRGLSRLLGIEFKHFQQETFVGQLIRLRKEIAPRIKMRLCLQDLQ